VYFQETKTIKVEPWFDSRRVIVQSGREYRLPRPSLAEHALRGARKQQDHQFSG
jgi:hypothetical protein